MTQQHKTLVHLALLYFISGLPFGFFADALPVYLRQQHVSLVDIGLASVLNLPWAFKPLWSPWVDRYASPRAWIFSSMLVVILSICSLAMVSVGSPWFWAWLFFGW